MNRYEVIGNLGANAEVKNENGKQFVSLRIADTRIRTKSDGSKEEKTVWVSATINGDGGNLLQYLVKGAKVWAIGEMELQMYHSEKQRALVAGIKLFVRDIQLISTNIDAVPRDLYDAQGAAHRTAKYFLCQDIKSTKLFDRAGHEYQVDDSGWVSQISTQQPATSTTDEHAAESIEEIPKIF